MSISVICVLFLGNDVGQPQGLASCGQRVAETAKHRCGYCQTQELIIGMPLQIEHIYPEAAGGDSDETNLWLACPRCNRYKSDRTHGIDEQSLTRVRLFNPRSQKWNEHFAWEQEGLYIVGLHQLVVPQSKLYK